jgi:quercetin dioxygenase-like cupin family protein
VNGEFECYTLEDCARPAGAKIPGGTCIPAGKYTLVINFSNRFQRLMPELLRVPGFAGIRIHAGNTDADTEGCILAGETCGEDFIGGSQAAFGRLFRKLQAARMAGREVRVMVLDAPGPRDEPAHVAAETRSAVTIVGMKVERWNAERDGVLSEAALRRKLEKLGYSASRYTYPPGTLFPPHTHAEEKMDAVLSGRFRIRMGGEEAVLGAGDAVLVPRGAEHSAEVVGAEAVISLDAVKAG